MINFVTLQDSTIPEGAVTQIAKDGVVLWKKSVAKDVTITFVEADIKSYNSEIARVTINGVVYDGSSLDSITVKVGTIIECYILVENTTYGAIVVDGEKKVYGQTGTYKHTVESDCTISCGALVLNIFGTTQKQGNVTITTVS